MNELKNLRFLSEMFDPFISLIKRNLIISSSQTDAIFNVHFQPLFVFWGHIISRDYFPFSTHFFFKPRNCAEYNLVHVFQRDSASYPSVYDYFNTSNKWKEKLRNLLGTRHRFYIRNINFNHPMTLHIVLQPFTFIPTMIEMLQV